MSQAAEMTMTQEAPAKVRTAPMPRHGVDTPKLFATIDVVKGQPELAQFQFRATSRWIKGTHCRSTMASFAGAGGEHQHVAAYKADVLPHLDMFPWYLLSPHQECCRDLPA